MNTLQFYLNKVAKDYGFLSHNHCLRTGTYVEMELVAQQGGTLYAEEACKERTKSLLMLEQPWNLKHILAKLKEATDVLLHEKDYDRTGWEEISHCSKLSEDWLKQFNSPLAVNNEKV